MKSNSDYGKLLMTICLSLALLLFLTAGHSFAMGGAGKAGAMPSVSASTPGAHVVAMGGGRGGGMGGGMRGGSSMSVGSSMGAGGSGMGPGYGMNGTGSGMSGYGTGNTGMGGSPSGMSGYGSGGGYGMGSMGGR